MFWSMGLLLLLGAFNRTNVELKPIVYEWCEVTEKLLIEPMWN